MEPTCVAAVLLSIICMNVHLENSEKNRADYQALLDVVHMFLLYPKTSRLHYYFTHTQLCL